MQVMESAIGSGLGAVKHQKGFIEDVGFVVGLTANVKGNMTKLNEEGKVGIHAENLKKMILDSGGSRTTTNTTEVGCGEGIEEREEGEERKEEKKEKKGRKDKGEAGDGERKA
ncbi:hypothetical protein MLD38_021767 [Melastoma candidum]|uniref:Uncharacterized protein n=1 Tax=Melastoma candidum TaxID=119954 RepID=A0ACB9QK13_9MYRT|nr:hypothetical protein MLD38_021767 [Melastoma candidum]